MIVLRIIHGWFVYAGMRLRGYRWENHQWVR
jgi:hypothetical protein